MPTHLRRLPRFWVILIGIATAGAFPPPPAAAVQIEHELRLPPPGTTDVRILTTADAAERQRVLSARTDGRVSMAADEAASHQLWVLSPVGRSTYRLQLFDTGQLWSLATTRATGDVALVPSAQDPRQLWRLVPSLSTPGAARLESVAYPTRSLAGSRDGVVALERTSGGPAQNWFLDVEAAAPLPAQPPIRMSEHALRPAEPLPPVATRLVNSHREELWVQIIDLRGGAPRSLTIPAGGAVDVRLDRGAGATLVETYEAVSPFGELYREQFVTRLPPAPLYEIAVYERFLQSVAIDRTGKSPDPIEDINYQGKGVGVFTLPPGPAFEGGTVDVYRAAQTARNPGLLPPLAVPGGSEAIERDPLEAALESAVR